MFFGEGACSCAGMFGVLARYHPPVWVIQLHIRPPTWSTKTEAILTLLGSTTRSLNLYRQIRATWSS